MWILSVIVCDLVKYRLYSRPQSVIMEIVGRALLEEHLNVRTVRHISIRQAMSCSRVDDSYRPGKVPGTSLVATI